MITVKVQAEDFDLAAETDALRAGRLDAGALVTFSGLVRTDGALRDMTLEHYEGMTEAALRDIAAEATQRWSLLGCVIIHRFGRLEPGEQIMMVAALAGHRHAAFEAADFMMDYLKSRAPFWKKERGDAGEEWVDAREDDEASLARWS